MLMITFGRQSVDVKRTRLRGWIQPCYTQVKQMKSGTLNKLNLRTVGKRLPEQATQVPRIRITMKTVNSIH